jgi:hypothetical protein
VVDLAARAAHSGDNWWSPILGNSSLDAETTLDILLAHGYPAARENPHSIKNRYEVYCPFHNDRNTPSISIHADGNQWKCWAECGKGGPATMRAMLGGNLIPRMDKPLKAPKPPVKKQERPSGCTLAGLAEAKGLPLDFLKCEMGWFDSTFYGIPAVAMPYENSTQLRVEVTGGRKCRWTNEGSPHNAKERYIVEPAEPTQGRRTALYVEGTTDCAAAKLIGLNVFVYGLPGTGTWTDKTGPMWAAEHQDDDVLVWQEPGEAGAKLAEKMAASLPNLRVIHSEEAGYKDLCELVASYAGDIESAKAYVEVLIEEAEPYHQPLPEEEVVGFRVGTKNPYYSKTDKAWKSRKRDNTRPSALWDFCCETFPDPPGVEPKVKSHILYSATEGRALVCDLRSPTWLNPANAAFKKRKFLFHGTRKLSAFDALYVKNVAVDDWSEEFHEAKARAIERAGGQYLAVDNQLSRGCWAYLSTVPIDGFAPLDDPSGWLVGVLSGIRMPDSIPKGRRFRPIRGSHALTKGCDAPVDEDRGKYEVVAVSQEATDWNLLEAELRAAGRVYEQVDPVYRAQHCWGIKFAASSLEEVQEFALGFGGVYQLRRRGKKPTEEQAAVGVGL